MEASISDKGVLLFNQALIHMRVKVGGIGGCEPALICSFSPASPEYSGNGNP